MTDKSIQINGRDILVLCHEQYMDVIDAQMRVYNLQSPYAINRSGHVEVYQFVSRELLTLETALHLAIINIDTSMYIYKPLVLERLNEYYKDNPLNGGDFKLGYPDYILPGFRILYRHNTERN